MLKKILKMQVYKSGVTKITQNLKVVSHMLLCLITLTDPLQHTSQLTSPLRRGGLWLSHHPLVFKLPPQRPLIDSPDCILTLYLMGSPFGLKKA